MTGSGSRRRFRILIFAALGSIDLGCSARSVPLTDDGDLALVCSCFVWNIIRLVLCVCLQGVPTGGMHVCKSCSIASAYCAASISTAAAAVTSCSDFVVYCVDINISGFACTLTLRCHALLYHVHTTHACIVPSSCPHLQHLGVSFLELQWRDQRYRRAPGAMGAAVSQPAPDVSLCHSTSSATNPFTFITVSANAVFKSNGGHFYENGKYPKKYPPLNGVENLPRIVE